MKTHHPANERIKKEYFTYLKEAKRYSEQTVDGVAKALHRFESYTGFKDFHKFHLQQAVNFKKYLAEQMNARTKTALSKATLYATLTALKRFFQWLAGQPGYKSRIGYADAEYFNLSDNDTRIAKAHREQPVPTLEQLLHVIRSMPCDNDIQLRDRALIALMTLTGARDGAVASLKLKHINLAEKVLDQDARDVKTKFRKTFQTWFFPVGDDVLQILVHWERHLRENLLWGLDDPLFPASLVASGANHRFEVVGLNRKHWGSATPIRKIFKSAFESAGLPYYQPHSIRKTLVRLGEQLCKSPEDFKAWSQNLGHEQVLTTFTSYGEVAARRQAEIIRGLGKPQIVGVSVTEAMRVLQEHIGTGAG